MVVRKEPAALTPAALDALLERVALGLEPFAVALAALEYAEAQARRAEREERAS